MSEYVMFYIKDDKSNRWIELDSFSRNTEMFQICKNEVGWEQWRELPIETIMSLQNECGEHMDRQKDMIESYRRNNEFLKTLNRPVSEIMEEKNSNDEMINECEDTLHELTGVMAELRVYAMILQNSCYCDNKVHICLAHECDPNDDDDDETPALEISRE